MAQTTSELASIKAHGKAGLLEIFYAGVEFGVSDSFSSRCEDLAGKEKGNASEN